MATLPQSTTHVRTFPMYLTGTKTPATGKTVAVILSKAGAAFGAAAGAVAEISAGWYKVSLTTVDTGTVGDLAYNCTAASCDPTDFTDQIGVDPVNLVQIDGTPNASATLNLTKLNVVNSGGDAAVFSSTGGNGRGINASGNGTGHGIVGTGGITGIGVLGLGGATSGAGVVAQAQGGNSNGLGCQGFGAGAGISATGGLTGDGIDAAGGATSGSGIGATANTAGHGFFGLSRGDGFSGITGQCLSGNGAGIAAQGNGSGSGIFTIGGATGHGINGEGGATSGSGAYFNAVGSGSGIIGLGTANGSGIYGGGNGTGPGIAGVGGNTGHGLVGQGGTASGNGLSVYATGSGQGINAVGVGSVSILATQGISGPFDASTMNAIADAALVRDWLTTDTSTAPTNCTINALRGNRNWAVSGSTYTAYKENGTTPAWTATLTTDAAGLPVVAFDSN